MNNNNSVEMDGGLNTEKLYSTIDEDGDKWIIDLKANTSVARLTVDGEYIGCRGLSREQFDKLFVALPRLTENAKIHESHDHKTIHCEKCGYDSCFCIIGYGVGFYTGICTNGHKRSFSAYTSNDITWMGL